MAQEHLSNLAFILIERDLSENVENFVIEKFSEIKSKNINFMFFHLFYFIIRKIAL